MTCGIQDITLVGMDAHSEKIELCVTRWRHGADPVTVKRITATLDAMEATFRGNVPPGAVVVLEASTNAFSVAGRLTGIGYRAKVLVSDTLAGMARADRVNDRIDARNLAAAYARGGTREVHVPSKTYAEWRDIWFGYRNAVKDAVKWSNRIWAFCSGHGFDLPKRQRRKKAAEIMKQVMELVYTVAKKQQAGLSIEELAGWIEDSKLKMCHWFTVDDLEYLKRGGRVSAAAATIATTLNIKPVMHMDNCGHLVNVKKVRGRRKSLAGMLEEMEKTYLASMGDAVFIGHGSCRDDADLLAQMIKEAFPKADVHIYDIGPVIGAHAGPGVLALFFWGETR